MPTDFYQPKSGDPKDKLISIHLKVPESILPIFKQEGLMRGRFASHIMRETLDIEAQKLKAQHKATKQKSKAKKVA